jgi:RNA polymerase-binding transcription factor DksA
MNPSQGLSNAGNGPVTAHPKPNAPRISCYEFRTLLQARRSQLPMNVDEEGIRRLRDIDVALARIHDGTYGVCFGCGGEIGRARLKADPVATRCLPCQGHGEK